MAALVVSIPTANARGLSAKGHIVPMSTASGWAGYVVRAGGRAFTEVTATWDEPRVVCNRPQSSAAFWVGIGGADRDSREVEFRNRSTGALFATEVTAWSLERGSAEWIAEAPASCFTRDCTLLPLADFARVVFSNAQASAGRLHGSIEAAGWTTQAIEMKQLGRAQRVVVSRLSRRGSSFAVHSLAETGR
jgi:Peptidase A4 family